MIIVAQHRCRLIHGLVVGADRCLHSAIRRSPMVLLVNALVGGIADVTYSCALIEPILLDGHGDRCQLDRVEVPGAATAGRTSARFQGYRFRRHRVCPLPRQAAFRLGGPVLWMVPSGNRMVSSRFGPNRRSHPLGISPSGGRLVMTLDGTSVPT